MKFSSEQLTHLAQSIIRAACGNETAAQMVAHRLVYANLTGHDSHGVGMLPAYVAGINAGQLKPDAQAEIVQDKGPFLLIDGQNGFGQVVADQAMTHAIERAKTHHFCMMSLRNSFHIGRIGDWGTMAADAGFISIHYVNVLSANPAVAPFGGSDARFVTNPYCTAIPKTERNPMILLDIATSTIAHGKARVAHLSGKPVPDGSLKDSTGAPTNDPDVLFGDPAGALTTFGAHKGFGLALLCDILGGSFSGGGAYLPEHVAEDQIINNMMTIVIDPDVFGGADAFYADLDKYTDWVKASPPAPGVDRVLFPGEPEQLALAERSAHGIPVDPGTWAQLLETAAAVGVPQGDLSGLNPV